MFFSSGLSIIYQTLLQDELIQKKTKTKKRGERRAGLWALVVRGRHLLLYHHTGVAVSVRSGLCIYHGLSDILRSNSFRIGGPGGAIQRGVTL